MLKRAEKMNHNAYFASLDFYNIWLGLNNQIEEYVNGAPNWWRQSELMWLSKTLTMPKICLPHIHWFTIL